jgi:hypothetical protein
MVGGKVVEVLRTDAQIWVNVADTHAPDDRCALWMERNPTSENVKPGDQIWWQGHVAMWTPAQNRVPENSVAAARQRCGVDYDIEIPRHGYSGAAHPGQAMIDAAYGVRP